MYNKNMLGILTIDFTSMCSENSANFTQKFK